MRHLLKPLALAAAVLGSAGAARAQDQMLAPNISKEKLAEALAVIQASYVDSVQEEAVTDAAIRGMLTELDPHSQYYSREQIAARREQMSGSFVGIGIQYLVQHDTIYVTQVLPDGPADRAGLQAGDRITKLDDTAMATAHLSNADVQKRVRGAANTTLRLELYRGLQPKPIALDVVRAPIADHSIKAAYMVSPSIGYIELAIFGRTTREEMDAALLSLQQQGMKDLILDLQGNGGGYVQSAIGVADEFLKRDQLVYYTMDKAKSKDYYYAAGTGHFPTGKLVVLVDQATASASEILTSALQDWDRAVVVGRRSFGKGLMQRPINLSDGSVLELSGARYYAPTGRSLQKTYKGQNYPSELTNRYTSGEMFDPSKVSFAKAPKFATLTSKRPVYGGMGVMPDRYVPLDTVLTSTWLQVVTGTGLVSEAAFDLVSKQREALTKAYPTFDAFAKQYTVPAPALEAVVSTAAAKGLHLPPVNRERKLTYLAGEIKGRMAMQLYRDNSASLQILNQQNPSFQEAVRLLNNPGQYEQCLRPGPGKTATGKTAARKTAAGKTANN